MSIYDELVPFQPRTEHEVEIENGLKEAELAKQRAAEALMLATMEAAKVVYDLMTGSDDEQVRLRAAEIIFSRTIPKVAAKHVEDAGETIDSADVASLKDSIVAEIKRKTGNG